MTMKTQSLWDTPKAVLRRKFIAIHSYLKKQEKYRINNLNCWETKEKQLGKKRKKISRRKEIIKIRAEMSV